MGSKKPSFIDRTISSLKIYYKDLILSALLNKYKVVIGILVAFIISLYGFNYIPFIFFADSDRNMIRGRIFNNILK